MKRILDGEEIEIDQIEAAEIRAEWEANEAAQIAQELAQAKAEQKERLIREKVESMLIPEFAEIDTATDKASVKAVMLR